MSGVVLINKPSGMTSFYVTGKVRRALGIKKAGHAGTLDPLATGVLPVMTERATRLIDLMPDEKKTYLAGFMLGMTTDTLDCEGEVLSDQPVCVSENEILAVLQKFSGEITQIPPMYSALCKDGVKLYELARKGIEVERKPRKAHVFSIELTEFDGECGKIRITCSKGTYVRTVIDDMGTALSCGAFMTSLVREKSCGFDISQCVSLDDFLCEPQKYLQSAEIAIGQYPSVCVTDSQAKRFINGGELDLARCGANDSSSLWRVYQKDTLIGLGETINGSLKPKCLL